MNFIEEIVAADVASGVKIITRFPPEPNGFLHIGHAKSIILNAELAKKYNGNCILRFDDTNPDCEDVSYVNAIIEDVKWLGYDLSVTYASDYYDDIFDCAVKLIKAGLAYVNFGDFNIGDINNPGVPTVWRTASIEDNLKEFFKMKEGFYLPGEAVLRAKIDLGAANFKLRDPVIYRIKFMNHYRTLAKWKIYPMYDFAHPLCDKFENISHSLCTLEFTENNELYKWYLEKLFLNNLPKQIEFSKLNIDGIKFSKRNIKADIAQGKLSGWTDYRLFTLAALRERGITSASIKDFCSKLNYSRVESSIDIELFNSSVRESFVESEKITIFRSPHELDIDGERYLIDIDDFDASPGPEYKRLFVGGIVNIKNIGTVRCTHLSGIENNIIMCSKVDFVKKAKTIFAIKKEDSKSFFKLKYIQGSIEKETIFNSLTINELKDGNVYHIMRLGWAYYKNNILTHIVSIAGFIK